jgi:hypothetical protein
MDVTLGERYALSWASGQLFWGTRQMQVKTKRRQAWKHQAWILGRILDE